MERSKFLSLRVEAIQGRALPAIRLGWALLISKANGRQGQGDVFYTCFKGFRDALLGQSECKNVSHINFN